MTPHVQTVGKGQDAPEAVAPVVVDDDLPMLQKSYDETDEEGLHHGALVGVGVAHNGVGGEMKQSCVVAAWGVLGGRLTD